MIVYFLVSSRSLTQTPSFSRCTFWKVGSTPISILHTVCPLSNTSIYLLSNNFLLILSLHFDKKQMKCYRFQNLVKNISDNKFKLSMNTLYVTSLLRDVGQIGLVEEYTNYNHSCIQTLNKGRFIVGRAMVARWKSWRAIMKRHSF